MLMDVRVLTRSRCTHRARRTCSRPPRPRLLICGGPFSPLRKALAQGCRMTSYGIRRRRLIYAGGDTFHPRMSHVLRRGHGAGIAQHPALDETDVARRSVKRDADEIARDPLADDDDVFTGADVREGCVGFDNILTQCTPQTGVTAERWAASSCV